MSVIMVLFYSLLTVICSLPVLVTRKLVAVLSAVALWFRMIHSECGTWSQYVGHIVPDSSSLETPTVVQLKETQKPGTLTHNTRSPVPNPRASLGRARTSPDCRVHRGFIAKVQIPDRTGAPGGPSSMPQQVRTVLKGMTNLLLLRVSNNFYEIRKSHLKSFLYTSCCLRHLLIWLQEVSNLSSLEGGVLKILF